MNKLLFIIFFLIFSLLLTSCSLTDSLNSPPLEQITTFDCFVSGNVTMNYDVSGGSSSLQVSLYPHPTQNGVILDQNGLQYKVDNDGLKKYNSSAEQWEMLIPLPLVNNQSYIIENQTLRVVGFENIYTAGTTYRCAKVEYINSNKVLTNTQWLSSKVYLVKADNGIEIMLRSKTP